MAASVGSVSDGENPSISTLPRPTRPPEPTWEGVADKLLREKLLLTGLELYLELEERGRELPTSLKDFFSNPGNFEARCSNEAPSSALPAPGLLRSSSQTTLDSLDWGRLSEDGERVGEEKIAVLEFELRKARETIQNLRATLTQATEQRLPTTTTTAPAPAPPRPGLGGGGGVQGGGGGAGRGERSSPAPHERRMLNFLVNEYLCSASYKLTAITFADENDEQDFESWDNVGINTSRPPSLVALLRDAGGGGGGGGGGGVGDPSTTTTTTTTASQTQEAVVVVEEVEKLQLVVERQAREIDKLQHQINTTSPASPRPVSPVNRTQAEGRPASTISPTSGAGLGDTGRESPEGTSDSEGGGGAGGASGAGSVASGFVMVGPPGSPIEDSTPEFCPEESIEDLLTDGACDGAGDGAGQSNGAEVTQSDSISDQIEPQGVSGAGQVLEEAPVPAPCPVKTPGQQGSGDGAGQCLNSMVEEARTKLRQTSNRRCPAALEERVLQAGLKTAAGRGGAMVMEALAGWGGVDLAGVVAKTLPRIAPNVILAKRQEVVALVVAGAGQAGAGESGREALVSLLFGLLRRPDEEQRGAVLAGLAALGRVLGPPRLEAELLPHVWGQLAHRRPERRLLVAEAVGCLAPHTPAPLRDSLLVSVLLQVVGGERDPGVREAALTSLAVLAAFLQDLDKLPLLLDAATHTLHAPRSDPAHQPATPSPGLLLLLGALGAWAAEAGRLPTLLDALLGLLEEQVAEAGQGGADVACTVRALAEVLPHLLMGLLASAPPLPEAAKEDDSPASPLAAPPLDTLPPCPTVAALEELWDGPGSAGAALAGLHGVLGREWLPPWPLLEHVKGAVLPRLVGAVAGLQTWPGPALDAFLSLFSEVPRCLGPALTANTLTPLFLAHLDGADPEAVRSCHTGLTGPVSVVYVAAVLGRGGAGTSGEMEGFLARQISILGLCGAPLHAPLLCVATLMAAPRHTEAVLGALWGAVVHRAPAVRAAAATLWGAAVGGVPDAALGARLVPALVTLASDQDIRVKAATLTPLATTLTTATHPEVVDKVWLQMETLADDVGVCDQKAFQLALAHTCTHLAHTAHPRLIHHFLLPRMSRIAMGGGGGAGVGEEVGAALLEAYSALTCCLLPDHVIAHLVLPPLLQLQKWLGGASFDYMETLTDLVKEYSLRAQTAATAPPERRKPSLSLSGGLPAPPNVEEVRTKMSKMFSTSSSTSSTSSSSSSLQARAQAINASLPGFLKKK